MKDSPKKFVIDTACASVGACAGVLAGTFFAASQAMPVGACLGFVTGMYIAPLFYPNDASEASDVSASSPKP